ncbi:Thi4 family [Aspergillus sclerotialis]|uniref:Amine oxidase n=1 Tax=Aspergillus sclerotialis TaxID=2070753 RepID=A0A3A3A313_9EURO|nr:Thi4 family [Aspergillus sclerotialis]
MASVASMLHILPKWLDFPSQFKPVIVSVLGGAWINDKLKPRVGNYMRRFGLDVVTQRLEGTAVTQASEKNVSSFLSADNITVDQYVRNLGALPKVAKTVNLWAEVMYGTILGDYNKAIVCYDKPWWRSEGFNGYFASYSGPLTLGRDTSVDGKDHYSLTCFVNGLPGRFWNKLPAHERHAAVLKQLSKVLKGNLEIFHPIEVFDQIWQHEELRRGALTPVHALDRLIEFASVYGRPLGNLHFVGTEYSTEWKGYMEGALCSGEEEARQVVEAMKEASAKF